MIRREIVKALLIDVIGIGAALILFVSAICYGENFGHDMKTKIEAAQKTQAL